MTALRTIGLVAAREVRERVASRSFQVTTAFTLLLILAGLLLPAIIASDSAPSYHLGVTGATPEDLDQLLAQGAPEPGTEFTTESYPDRNALEDALVDDTDIGVVDGTLVLVGPGTDPGLTALVVGSLESLTIEQRATDLGLTPEQLSQIFVGGVAVDTIEETDEHTERSVIAFIGTLLLFVSIATYGQWILIGVVEEKTSRVVEVILGAVQPRHLLAGKVVGIGALGLAQLLLIAGVGIFAAQAYADLEVPTIGFDLAFTVLGWFALGFTFYAAGYAVAGSLVSRQEDAQNVSFPLTMVMLIAYFVASSSLGGEDNPALRILSLVPPFSPMTMPVRQALGVATTTEVVISVALMVIAIFAMLRVGGRVYAAGLLRSGGRVKLRQALRTSGS